MLLACTTKCPFTNHVGKMFLQCEGVIVGSPLGVTFTNFYVCNLENDIMKNYHIPKPAFYVRYVDDCFVVAKDLTAFDQLIP